MGEQPFVFRQWPGIRSYSARVREVSGLTEREIGYMVKQGGIGVDEPGTGTARDWTALPVAQAVLFGMLHDSVKHTAAFTACRYLRDVVIDNDLDVLADVYLVIRGTQVAFVHDATEIPNTAVSIVVDMNDVLEKVAEVLP